MGIVNVYKGLDSEREIYNFNGRIKKNLDLDWKHCKIFLGSKELKPGYCVKEDDVIIIREYPGAVTAATLAITAIVVGVVSVGVGIGSALYARHKASEAQRELDRALRRIDKNNRRRDIESIPHLSGGRNEFAEGKQIPIILGRHLFTPYFLSEPYLEVSGTDGIDLHWYATLLVGQRGLSFEKIRNGAIDLVSFDYSTATPSGRYDFIPVAGDPDNPPPFHEAGNFVEVRQHGYFNEQVFNERWEDSLEANIEIGRKRGDNAATEEDIFVADDGPEPVVRETAKFPMRIEAEILVDGLHGWDSRNGVATSATVTLRIEWSRDGETGWSALPGWGDMTLTRNSARQLRFIASIDLPASVYSNDGAPVYIRATRLTRQHVGGFRSRTILTAIRTKQYSPSESMTPENPRLVPAKNIAPALVDKFCRIGVKIKVNQNTQEALDRFNVIASMTGRTWNGRYWSLEKKATSNPAAVALEVLTGLIHEPSRHKDSEIDLQSLGRLYDWCNDREVLIEGSGRRPLKLEACGVLTGAARKLDVLQSILSTADAGMYVSEYGKLRFWFDDFQTIPEGLLNPQRLVSMRETRNLQRRLDGYAVSYIDRDGDWSERTERVMRPRVERIQGKNTFDAFNPEYVTDHYHVMWLARRMMAREILQPGEIEVEVGREGKYYKPGTLIKVQHEGHRIGIGSGEVCKRIINEGGATIGLETMERFEIRSDRDYWVDYHVVSYDRNHVVTRQLRYVADDIDEMDGRTNRLMFTVPLHEHDKPALGNIVSVIDGPIEAVARVQESKRCVVMDSSPTRTGYTLKLVRYDDEIYRTTSIDAIPDYISAIQPRPHKMYRPTSQLPRDGIDGQDGEDGEDGIDGRGISSVTFTFMRTNSDTPPPENDPAWNANAPSLDNNNRFLWSRERILFTDGTSDYFVTLKAQMGPGIESMTFHFMRTNTNVAPAANNAGWATTAPVLDATSRWLWSRETIVFTDGRANQVTVVLKAERGENGRGIREVAVRFRASNSETAPTQGWNDWFTSAPVLNNNNRFLWSMERTLFTDGTHDDIVVLKAQMGPGIASMAFHFMRTNTNAAPAANNAGWATTAPVLDAVFRWLWSRETIVFTDGRANQVTVVLKAERGRDGIDGDDGRDGSNAPRYRGAIVTPDLQNTGIINGEVMNVGDFMVYTGVDMGVNSIWRPGNIVQWDGVRWNFVRLDDSSSNMYWIALPDIVRGTPRQIASEVLAGTLLANEAFIETLVSDTAIIERIFAQSIRAENLHIGGNSFFSGSITTGPLEITNDVATGNTINLPVGTRADSSLLSGASVIGTFGSMQIRRINTEISSWRNISDTLRRRTIRVFVISQDGSETRIAYLEQNLSLAGLISDHRSVTTTQPLSFRLVLGGAKAIKLNNLPESPPSQSGALYRDEIWLPDQFRLVPVVAIA